MHLSHAKLFPLGVSGLVLLLAGCSAAAPADHAGEAVGTTSAAIDATPVSTFGANPGNLLMYSYIPQGMPDQAPLVLSLHGCTQEVSGDQVPAMEAAGWNALADQYKFYLVYPQQQSANNTEGCFNFFGNTSGSLADITRGQGEAESIHEMVTYMQSTYSIDPARIYVTGFSAGAAYAVALLALYPDVFAAGASFEGLPFGCATSLSSAYLCMYTATNDTASQWEMLVKNGDPGYTGPYPRISIWEGTSDTTVVPANLSELVSQWTAVTGASTSPSAMTSQGSYAHATYTNGSGEALVETYTITGMSHAVAIDSSSNCGTAGTYFVDEGICAADAVAKFFGLEGPQSAPPAASDAGASNNSGGQGQGNGGGGMNSLGSSGAGASGTATGSGSGGAVAEAPDAGTGPATMPGCSASPSRSTTGLGVGFFGIVVAVAAVLRRKRAAGKGSLVGIVAVLLSLVAFLVPSRASADEGEPPSPDTAPAAGTHLKPAILGPQGAFFTGASVNTTPALLFGVFPFDHFATTAGFGMSYNANGSPVSPLTGIKGAPNNRFGADFMLDAMYFVYDKAPFAMGPELNLIGSLSPNYPLTVVVVTPMWALRYAPWKAPIAIGTGLGAGIAFERGAKPMVNLATQGLDIVYAF